MAEPFPATYTTLSPRAIREQILPEYEIGALSRCCLHMTGVNDIYLVETASGRYVFKVYRWGWRSPAEVSYELDLLAHLHGRGVPVSLPVPRKDGSRIGALPALEGSRPAVLFTYAPGRPPRWPFHEDESESRLMGSALAAIHAAADDFRSGHPRSPLDERLLLDGLLRASEPFLASREGDWAFLLQLTGRIRERLADLAGRGLTWGICHGDYHPGNLFIGDDGTVTAFDFDVCGAGWLAFDLARWRGDTEGKAENSWRAFLEGYQERRKLPAVDLEAVPLFVLLRTLDWMRIKSTFTASEQWESWDMPFYLDDTLRSLRTREAAAFASP